MTAQPLLDVAEHYGRGCGRGHLRRREYWRLFRRVQQPFERVVAEGVVDNGLVRASELKVDLGIILFSLGVFITILLLPIEFDASSRALKILQSKQILTGEELSGARKVLTAAGLTYVAAAASSILSLLRLVLLSRSRND